MPKGLGYTILDVGFASKTWLGRNPMKHDRTVKTAKDWFGDRVAVLATMHRKEEAIAPILETALALQVTIPTNLNTDQFGTFTREVARPGTQLEAARLKAQQGLAITGASLGLASEGSFGPHPVFPYIACNREIVVLLDPVHGLELVGQDFSTETNYAHQRVTRFEEALAFAKKAGFPSHGLVVMPTEATTDPQMIHKGITDEALFEEVVMRLLKQQGQVHLETDMRAMVNPTRMRAIARAAADLARKAQQLCPHCGTPGFDVSDRRPGLPCELCGSPTDLPLEAIYTCNVCGFTKADRFPNGVETADPAQCQFCNP